MTSKICISSRSEDPSKPKIKTKQELPRGLQNLLIIFKDFVKTTWPSAVTRPSWTSIDPDDFALFRGDWQPTNAPIPPPALQQNPPPPVRKHSPAELFNKNVKRDVSHYMDFKSDDQWDDWQRDTKAMARTHGCAEVFDSSYKPSTPEEISIVRTLNKTSSTVSLAST